ncbi:Aste57867_25268 [Aphanomyces stellatus]|uniref:Aste57867_25268 protein n=1 Tax=Aphanomyces stellatus TaxID=120398 RepID=A0A485LV41_9STRA|nr:hypothetical protein As57867_025190 [Aphanomyces stellatus]VFU01894.1 Aste57867_25268 [Aphanomyces stellatus]
MDMATEARLRKDAEERVALRRDELKKAVNVRDIRSHEQIDKCFRKANQIYRQCQVYVVEGDLDHAYIYLWLLVELYQRKMPRHRDFGLLKYENERKRLDKKCRDALALLERILDGMFQEELQQAQDAHEDEVHMMKQSTHPCELSAAMAKVSVSHADPVAISLESRLHALKGKVPTHLSPPLPSSPPSSAATTVSVSSASTDSAARERAFSTIRLKSNERAAAPPSVRPPPPLAVGVSYPSVHPEWMNADIQLGRPSFRSMQDEVRALSVPSSLVAEFTRIAEPNTLKPPYGVETCGILAGTLKDQKLSITTLIIPKQQGSADTCTMTNEEDLFEFCIARDLLTLGWIHTHPSQTCFLSSVDIHTQCGFQSMLSEAIAIVVAPRDPQKNIGVFRLTSPHGLELIQNCNLTGFHEHPSNVEIYSDAMQVTWDAARTAAVVDMRRE